MPQFAKHGNYFYLLTGLSLLLLPHPIFLQYGDVPSVIALHIPTSLALILGVWTLVNERKWFLYGIGLACMASLINMLEFWFEHLVLTYLIIGLQFLFFSLTLWIAFHDVMFNLRLDLNRIVGAVCIYLLLGLLWSLGYLVINLVSPGSFSGLQVSTVHHQMSELIYFSFVTLTTLGFGEIAPITPVARTLVYFEAIIGQIYLAVLVAGLVGAYVAADHEN